MKTVTGRVIRAEPISLSKAATLLSGFASSDNGATKAFRVYLRRASDAFTELKSFHKEIKPSSVKETGELVRAKGVDDLARNGGKIRFRKSENLVGEVSVHGLKQDEIKEDKKRKKKSKNKKEEYVVDEKLKEKLEYEQRNEDGKKKKRDVEIGSEKRKSKKRRKSKEIDG